MPRGSRRIRSHRMRFAATPFDRRRSEKTCPASERRDQVKASRIENIAPTTSGHFRNESVVRTQPESIEWQDYALVEPGTYRGYSRAVRVYIDRGFQRWVCQIRWDILRKDGSVIARLVQFLNLGSGQNPKASRRSKYWAAWIHANGGRPPLRHDRLSHRIFTKRYARVEVETTLKSSAPYSQVRKVVEWETGMPNHSIK